MKTKMFMILTAITMLLSLAIPAPARAENTRIDFTGIETGCTDPVWTKEWGSGPNFHISGVSSTCYDVANKNYFTGTNYISDGMGHFVAGGAIMIITGKFRMETEEGGVWVGTFITPANTTILTAVGQGEGIYWGLQIHMFQDQNTGEFWGYVNTGE